MSGYFVWACEAKTSNFLALSDETNLACRFPTVTRTSYSIILMKIPNIIIIWSTRESVDPHLIEMSGRDA